MVGGGGGVGDPLNRPPEKVRMDALNEYISIKRAKEIYGVVIDSETFELDHKATRELREELREAKKH
jgi:N-methylhydantoinase B